MFEADKPEYAVIGKKARLPKPGTNHSNGGKFRGRGLDRWTDKRIGPNRENPHIRGQSNIVQGRFIEEHESDSDVPAIVASVAHYSTHRPIAQNGRYKPLRMRAH